MLALIMCAYAIRRARIESDKTFALLAAWYPMPKCTYITSAPAIKNAAMMFAVKALPPRSRSKASSSFAN